MSIMNAVVVASKVLFCLCFIENRLWIPIKTLRYRLFKMLEYEEKMT